MNTVADRIPDMINQVYVPDLSPLQREIVLMVEPIIENITDEKKN